MKLNTILIALLTSFPIVSMAELTLSPQTISIPQTISPSTEAYVLLNVKKLSNGIKYSVSCSLTSSEASGSYTSIGKIDITAESVVINGTPISVDSVFTVTDQATTLALTGVTSASENSGFQLNNLDGNSVLSVSACTATPE